MAWPMLEGGGVAGATDLLNTVAALVQTPLPPAQLPRDTLLKCQQAIYTHGHPPAPHPPPLAGHAFPHDAVPQPPPSIFESLEQHVSTIFLVVLLRWSSSLSSDHFLSPGPSRSLQCSRLPVPPVRHHCAKPHGAWIHLTFSPLPFPGLVRGVVQALLLLGKRLDVPPGVAPLDLLNRLAQLSSKFLAQLVRYGGLAALRDVDALAATAPEKVVALSLGIASQAAKASGKHYEGIRRAGVLRPLYDLLAHHSPTVRAKTCNLIGYLCRHSDRFYEVSGRWRLSKESGGPTVFAATMGPICCER